MKTQFRALALAVTLATTFTAAADAAVTIDQVNLVDPMKGALVSSSIRTIANNSLGRFGQLQSVTAGQTGKLARLDLQMLIAPQQPRDVAFRIELFDGEPGVAGPLTPFAFKSFTLASVPLIDEAQQGALFSADLAELGFNVTAGQQFSYAVTIADELVNRQGPSVVLGYDGGLDEFGEQIVIGLDYQGGFNTLLNSDGTRSITGLDRGFRTWVDSAVPEPATWAMMIGGFGLAGAAMRRRHAPAQQLA